MDSRKVLIAEDDSSVRKAVQRVLELENYVVTAVNDGKAALEALATSRFDLAVLDVMMPFADGLTVCREARHRGINIPILLLTARVEVGDRVAGLDAGAVFAARPPSRNGDEGGSKRDGAGGGQRGFAHAPLAREEQVAGGVLQELEWVHGLQATLIHPLHQLLSALFAL